MKKNAFVAGAVTYAPNSSVLPPAPPAALSQCVFAEVAPHATTGWIDVGRMMDTLDHSSWNLPLGNYSLQIGVVSTSNNGDGSSNSSGEGGAGESAIKALPAIYSGNPAGEGCSSAATCTKLGAATSILIDASTRATQRTRDISAGAKQNALFGAILFL